MVYEALSNRTSATLFRRPGSRSCAWVLLLLLSLACSATAESTWHTEVVDNGSGVDVGKSASLAIDSQGNTHIAYYNNTALNMWYAFRPAGDARWFKMEVPGSEGAYPYISLAADSQGRPHLAFITSGKGLMYAHWDGKMWSAMQIDDIRAAYYTSIAVDAADHPHISYYREYTGSYRTPANQTQYIENLKYAFFDGKQWYVETIDRRFGTGKYNSMFVDGKGNAYIAYTHIGWWTLLYASGHGTDWHLSMVDMGKRYGHFVGQGNSIALDSSGNPHIAYFDTSASTVRYASLQGGKWKLEIVAQMLGRTMLDHLSLKIDSNNRAHIAFYDSGTGSLKYAVQAGDKWQVETVDTGNTGMSPSLYLDSQNQPSIAYYDVAEHSLKLAQLRSGNSSSVTATTSK